MTPQDWWQFSSGRCPCWRCVVVVEERDEDVVVHHHVLHCRFAEHADQTFDLDDTSSIREYGVDVARVTRPPRW
jgi:hypothetical protein